MISRLGILTHVCQVRVNSLSRQRQPSRSTGAKSVQQWTPSSTSASIPRSTQAPAAGLLLGIKPRSAVELAGESDRMTTTNSVVNGHLSRSRSEKRGLTATGLNALPIGVTIQISGKPARPPERELGQNSTLADNSTTLVNATYAVPVI